MVEDDSMFAGCQPAGICDIIEDLECALEGMEILKQDKTIIRRTTLRCHMQRIRYCIEFLKDLEEEEEEEEE